jgi:hypothetical protein
MTRVALTANKDSRFDALQPFNGLPGPFIQHQKSRNADFNG